MASKILTCGSTTIQNLCNAGIMPHKRRFLRRESGERIISVADVVRIGSERGLSVNIELLENPNDPAYASTAGNLMGRNVPETRGANVPT